MCVRIADKLALRIHFSNNKPHFRSSCFFLADTNRKNLLREDRDSIKEGQKQGFPLYPDLVIMLPPKTCPHPASNTATGATACVTASGTCI